MTRIVVTRGARLMEIIPPITADPAPIWIGPFLPEGAMPPVYAGRQRWVIEAERLLPVVQAALDEFGQVEVVRQKAA